MSTLPPHLELASPDEAAPLQLARDAARTGLQRIVRLAARYAEVPCAQVVFFDPAQRIWNLTEGALRGDTPDAWPLCTALLGRADVEMCTDLGANDEWAALAPPEARFFGGVVCHAGTRRLAALCLWDTQPRVMRPGQVAFLSELAAALADPVLRYESEAQRHRTESRLSRIAEAMPDALVLASDDRSIRAVNPAFEALFGYELADVLGASTRDLYADPDDFEQQGRVRFNREAPDEASPYQVVYRRRDGSTFVGETVGVRIGGGGDGYLGLIRDVSERVRLHDALAASEQRLREVVENTPVVLWATDADGVFTLSDGRGLEPIGRAPGEDVGHSIFELYAAYPAVLAEVRAGLRGETRRWRAEVEGIVFDNVARPLFEGDAVVGLIGVSQDVTPQHRSEEELRAARDDAEGAARLIRAFLANVNHELRTPLTGLLGSSEWLLQQAPPDLEEPLLMVHQNSLRLKATLDSILDLARLDAGEMPTDARRFDAAEALRGVVRENEALAEQRGLTLRLRTPEGAARAEGPEQVLRRIAHHLLANAVKFTEEGAVEVVLEREPERLRLVVRDTGPGIDARFLPHVFDAFEQESDGWGRSHDGVGIGLTIAHKLAHLAGGTIEAASVRGEGSTFTVELPCTWLPDDAELDAAPPAGRGPAAGPPAVRRAVATRPAVRAKPSQVSAPRRPPAEANPLARPTSILVASASASARSLVGAYLMGICEVHAVESLAEALVRAEERPFDLLLLDPDLGEADGEAPLARLRRCAGTADAYAVALGAAPGADGFDGFDGTLAQPLDETDLLLTLRDALVQ